MSHRNATFIFALLTACGPAQVDCPECGGSDTGTDTGTDGHGDGDGFGLPDMGGAGDGDGVGDGLCEAPPLIACESQNDCWASHNEWSAHAQAITVDTATAAEQSGLWVPTTPGCWSVYGSDGHVCVVDVCGVLLLGRPVDEISVADGIGCDYVGIWSETGMVFGACVGIIGDLAVRLKS